MKAMGLYDSGFDYKNVGVRLSFQNLFPCAYHIKCKDNVFTTQYKNVILKQRINFHVIEVSNHLEI